MVGLNDDVNVLAVLLDDVVHRRRIPGGCFGRLLFAEIDAELVLVGRGTALFVDGPSVSLVAAADDAIVAGDVEFLGVPRDDREPVDVTFESHCCLPYKTLDSRPYRSSRPPRRRRRRCVDAQHVLREVLGCVAPGLLAPCLDIETRVVTWAIQR